MTVSLLKHIGFTWEDMYEHREESYETFKTSLLHLCGEDGYPEWAVKFGWDDENMGWTNSRLDETLPVIDSLKLRLPVLKDDFITYDMIELHFGDHVTFGVLLYQIVRHSTEITGNFAEDYYHVLSSLDFVPEGNYFQLVVIDTSDDSLL